MSRRRNSPPPFEIMQGLPGGASPPVREPSVDLGVPGGQGRWWERAKYPVMLRVPQGYVVLAGLFLVAIVVLAYMVGHARGKKEGIDQERQNHVADLPEQRMRVVNNVDEAPGQHAGGGTAAGQASPGVDPRTVDLNYYDLATDDYEGARRLLNFLWNRGIDAAAFSTSRSDQFVVVALDHGFTAEQIGRGEHDEYRRRLMRVGAEWANEPGGRSFTSLGMQLRKYKGEKVAKIILRDK